MSLGSVARQRRAGDLVRARPHPRGNPLVVQRARLHQQLAQRAAESVRAQQPHRRGDPCRCQVAQRKRRRAVHRSPLAARAAEMTVDIDQPRRARQPRAVDLRPFHAARGAQFLPRVLFKRDDLPVQRRHIRHARMFRRPHVTVFHDQPGKSHSHRILSAVLHLHLRLL